MLTAHGGKHEMPQVPHPLGYTAHQVEGTGEAVCPGCKIYKCGSRPSYRSHTRQCAWFQELLDALDVQARQQATQAVWMEESSDGEPTVHTVWPYAEAADRHRMSTVNVQLGTSQM